ncbi:MAG: GFA family protein [Pseudomonadota bacterium]
MSERIARCGCGDLAVTVQGKPAEIHACSCFNCQRESGSAFSYTAVFSEADVALAGARKVWRRHGDSGRWLESVFCPTCGGAVLSRAEHGPGTVGIPVGCFADPTFAPPEKLVWAVRRHHWLELPEAIEIVEREPE